MTGEGFPQLLKARGEILEALYGEGDTPVANEDSQICHSHSDYLWRILNEGRP